jgi:HK97 family phage portal protein
MIQKIKSFFEKNFDLIRPTNDTVYAPPKMEDYLKEGVRSWAFMAMNAIALRIAMLDIEAYKIDANGNEQPIKHPITEILKKPNPLQTKDQFVWMMVMYYLSMGEVPIWLDKPNNPTQLVIINPAKIKPHYNEDVGIDYYEYRKENGIEEKIQAEQIIFLNLPNLERQLRGQGIPKYVAETLDMDRYFENYLNKFFWNNASPGFLFKTNSDSVSKESIKRFLSKWKSKHQGYKNSHQPDVLVGMDYVKTGSNLKEMALKEFTDYTRDKVLASFQVPKSVLGITDDVRANTDVADRTFARYAVHPRVKMIEQEFNSFLLPKYGKSEKVVIRFENPVTDDKELNAKIHQMYVNMGVMRPEQVAEEIGIEYIEPEIPEQLKPENQEQEEENQEENEEKSSLDKLVETKLKQNIPTKLKFSEKEIEDYHYNKIGMTDPQEEKLKENLNRYFKGLANRVVRETREKAQIDGENVEVQFDEQREERRLKKIIEPFYNDVFVKQSAIAFGLLGMLKSFDKNNPEFKEWKDDQINNFSGTVTNTIKEKIEKTYDQDLEPIVAKREIYKKLEDQNNNKKSMIARTEVQLAAGFASVLVFRSVGAVGYKWQAVGDERTCQFCRPMDGKIIKKNQTFWPKGSKMGGDELGLLNLNYTSVKHPPLHPHCRCSITPIFNKREIPSNPLSFREESERRLSKREEKRLKEEQQVKLVEKLELAKQKLIEKKKELDERENKIKEVEKLL